MDLNTMTEKDATEQQPLLRKQAEMKVPSKTLLMAAWAAGIGGTFQYGYNISIINAPTKEVQRFINQTWLLRYDRQISAELLTVLWSSIVSVFTIGGLVGAAVGASLAVRLGRKGTLLINNSFALFAAVLTGLSSLTAAFELLIAGRFISGINAGVGLCVQPLYLGEIAPRAVRGTMAMGTSIFITGGILTGQVIGLNELLGGEHYWPLLLISPCVPAVLQLVILPHFPESPRFLLIDRDDERSCTAALKQLHGGEYFQVEMEEMQRERIGTERIESLKLWQLFTECRNRLPLFIIILISTAQQLNGINAIYFYAGYVFSEAGIPAENIPYVTMGTGVCECVTALTCSLLIERWGRRALIIGGYTLMSLWCVCFTLTLSFQKSSYFVPYLSMLCVFAFILNFGLGPGGVTNILITELFTQSTRPAAYMVAGAVNWLSFFFISLVFPFIVNGLQQFCFLVFLVICCIVATFIFLFVPETKNKTFLEIQSEFSRKRTKVSQLYDGGDVSQLYDGGDVSQLCDGGDVSRLCDGGDVSRLCDGGDVSRLCDGGDVSRLCDGGDVSRLCDGGDVSRLCDGGDVSRLCDGGDVSQVSTSL